MKVLYLCTHNRCRSILSEAITNHYGGGRITARSAGSHPSGEVHPLSLRYLAESGIPTQGLKSQAWDELKDFAPDIVITVCNSAAGESCPLWFGHALKLHWGLADPSAFSGSALEVDEAFRHTIAIIKERLEVLKALCELDKSLWSEYLKNQEVSV